MTETVRTDFLAILKILTAHRVDFIVVGGVCAVLQGAPVTTFDLDIVHSRDSGNVDRLLGALEALAAHYRLQPERRMQPQASHLLSEGHQLLMTRFGPLDVLGAIGNGHDYPKLLDHSTEMDIGTGPAVRTLQLKTLIEIKEETAGEKDKAVLPVLRRTLEERSKPKKSAC